MRKRLSVFAFLVLVLLFSPQAVQAAQEERILLFDATATVHTDASVTVRERLLVNVLGDKIKRGIIRVFPTDYVDEDGRSVRTEFELVSAALNGAPVQFAVERRGGNIEIRFGRTDVLLEPGAYLFEIVYRTSGWLGFFKEHDELYWNVTGNDWIFPIEHVVYRVELPEGASVRTAAGYTGRRGERGSDFVIAIDGSFETTRTLAPGEGFTVATGWEKGIVTPPPLSFSERMEAFLPLWRLPVMAVFVAVVFLYYFLIWRAKGEDPAPQPIIPLFEAPPDTEPGFSRYFREGCYSPEVLASDILKLAVEGHVRFEEREDTTWIVRSEKEEPNTTISPVLSSLMNALFSGRFPTDVPVDTSAGRNFYQAEKLLKDSYENKSSKYSSWNLGWTLLGLLLFLPMFWIVDYLGSPLFAQGDVLDTLLVPLLLFLASAVLWFFALEVGKLVTKRRRGGWGYWIGFAVALFFAWLSLRMMINMLRSDPGVAGGFILASLIVLFFARIMPVRSEEGARLGEKIDGLAMYMGTAEHHRLSMLNPPEETPALFEKLLPYALALDIAKTWADRFSSVLANAQHDPEWSSESVHRSEALARTNALLRLSTELSKNMRYSASRYTPPKAVSSSSSSSRSRSSGLGGRGSSGGGGGGGGGRGW